MLIFCAGGAMLLYGVAYGGFKKSIGFAGEKIPELDACLRIRFRDLDFMGFSEVYLPGPAVSAPSPVRPRRWAASWRILYFRILPAAFMGKLSTNSM